MEKTNYISLLTRFIKTGSLSSQERETLQEWFTSADSYDELHTYYREHWQESKDTSIPLEIQERMFSRIKESIDDSERVQKKPLRRKLYSFSRYAAAVIISMAVGIGGMYWYSRYEARQQSVVSEPREYLVTADKGQRAKVTLPDGTEVWLNSHTQIRYTSNYGINDRRLSLVGEAFFEVAKDSLSRFIVHAGEMEVEALGTSFNIKAYNEDAAITATLFTGSVKTTVGNDLYTLKPNQFAYFNRRQGKMRIGESINASHARMWLDNELAFNGETMGEIGVILERLSNVRVQFASERVKKYKFSGIIRNNSLDNIIEIISLTAPITYRSNGDTIIISEKP